MPRWPTKPRSLIELVNDYERQVIEATMKRNAGSQAKAAQALGITLRTLERRLAKHGLLKRVRWARRLPIKLEKPHV
jgi:DNA-binding NtrC family response regulator